MSSTLITRLTEFVSTQTEEPSKKDLENALKEIYKSKKTTKKSNDGEEKQKRKPSAYNIYYAEQSAIIKKKEENMPKEERMTALKNQLLKRLLHLPKKASNSKLISI